MKSDKTRCIIGDLESLNHVDLEFLIKKQITLKIIQKNLKQQKQVNIFLCISLRGDAADLVNFEKKKMLPLTPKQLKSHQDSTICYIFRKKFAKT